MKVGPAPSAGLGNSIEDCGGNGKKDECVEVPGLGNTAMQNGVQSALAAAAGTIVAGKLMKYATHTSQSRVVTVIIHSYGT